MSLNNLLKALNEYDLRVLSMSDRELWEHCFDGEEMEEDFCIQELKRRFFRGDGLSDEEVEEIKQNIFTKAKESLENETNGKDS